MTKRLIKFKLNILCQFSYLYQINCRANVYNCLATPDLSLYNKVIVWKLFLKFTSALQHAADQKN